MPALDCITITSATVSPPPIVMLPPVDLDDYTKGRHPKVKEKRSAG
jgi:hypothetical protein